MTFTADKLKQARDAGYSDDEIWGFAAQQDDRFNKAKDAGYSLDEVSGFLTQKEKQPEGVPVMAPDPIRDYNSSVAMVQSLAKSRDENYGRYQELSQLPERTPEAISEMVKSFEAGKQAELNLFKEQETMAKLQAQVAEQEQMQKVEEAKRAREQAAAQVPVVEPIVEDVGQLEGIKNAAMNAFDASRQAMAVSGGVTPEEAETISKLEYQKEARKLSPAYSEYLQAEGMDAVKAFAKNPFEITTNIVAEGLAGSLYSLGAGVAAGGVAAAATAATGVGAPLAPAAFLGGQIGGTFAGSLATEYGSKVLEELQNAGMDLKDPESIKKFFSDEKLTEDAKNKALKRGVPVAIFDGVSAGIGGRLARLPVQALTKTPTRLAVTEGAAQAALGGGGEIAGAVAAGEKVQPKAVFAEVLGEAGPAAAEITVGRIAERMARTPEQKQLDQNVLATQVATRASQDVAPATADVVERQVQDTLIATAETPDQRVARLQQEAKAAAGITLEEEGGAGLPPVTPAITPTPEIAQAAQTRITEREGQAVTPVEEPTGNRVEAAAYQAPDGTVYYGLSHLDAMAKARDAGKIDQAAIDAKQEVTSRETPEFGFATNADPFVTRDQAETIARQSGQITVEQPATGKLHSNEVSLDAFAQPVTPAPTAARAAEAAPAGVAIPQSTALKISGREDTRAEYARLEAEGMTREEAIAELQRRREADKKAIRDSVAQAEIGDIIRVTEDDGTVVDYEIGADITRTGRRLNVKRADGTGSTFGVEVDAGVPAHGLIAGGTIIKRSDWNAEQKAKATPTPEAAPATVEPTPVTPPPVTPQLEPLRRVARAEQTEEDVAGLVDAGFAEVYKGQPVLTQAGLEALPEAERPRLTPEARKIQIDTRTSEAAAEAISKNLRIGVDQVPVDVRMPEGWTLEGDIYVPPQAPVPTPEVTLEVVPPRQPDTEPEVAADQEIKTIQEKYQTSEPTAGLILNQKNFVANEAGVIPEGWVVERISDRNIALSPVWQKSRRDIQEALRKFTVLERAALSGRLFEEGWINEAASKQYIADVRRIGAFKQEELESSIAAAETEANERFDDLVERVFKANRANVSDVAGEVSKPAVDLAAEEQARAARPVVSYGAALDPNVIEFKTARQALQMLADANIIATGDEDAEGNAAWRTDPRVQKPRYVLLQEAASILAKTNLRALDAELIKIDSGGGRANRAYSGNIFIPRTRGSQGETAYLEPWILLHEVGHTLTSDAFQKYVPDTGRVGADYYNQLKAAQKDKSVPREVKRAITLYIDTIKALGLEKEYFKKNGLASNDGDRAIRNAKIRTANKIINPFTGKQITTDDMYALGDMHEFYAQAWNSQSFQDILKQIKVAPQRSAFQKFVDIIKDVLGFESDTMAYSVIDASLRLASLEAPAGVSTIESRIDFARQMTNIRALPKTKANWYNYGTSKFSFGQPMTRNKFTKLGYDYITFRLLGFGRGSWVVRAEISESWNPRKKKTITLPVEEIFAMSFNNKASAQDIAERLMSDVTGLVNEKYGKLKAAAPKTKPSPPTERRKFAPQEPEAIPTFTEGTPEAATLKEMQASMAKVDAASEAKGGKPETYKISEIASVWMDSGLGERELRDAIVEYTNLTPANAAKVAKAIARQYDIQQSIATAFLETQTGLSVEALPEGVALPKEVDPDRPKPVMQRLFEVFMGVRVPPVKITGNEKTLLKQQIRLKAAANRAAKAAQKETSDQVIEVIKAMDLRGVVRPKQVQALAKRAARVIWTNEKSVETFTDYAAKVVENANYDADLREAKAAQARARQLSKHKKIAAPQREMLDNIAKIPVNRLDDPRMYADAVNYYLRGFKSVLSPDYVVIPDSEMTSYLSQMESQSSRNQKELDDAVNQRLAEKYGVDPDDVNKVLEAVDIIKQIEADENREAIDNLLTEKAIETQDGLKAYDQTPLRPDQRKVVDFMMKVDPKALDAEERQRFIRITNNIIYNNQTNGAEYFVSVAKGQQNARQASQDSDTIAKNKAWINLLPRFVSERMQRGWALELQSVADTFRNAFGKGAMAKIYKAMGMLDLNMGFTKANNTIDEIQEKIAEFHRGLEKKYKAAARNQDGLLAEGVAGFLIQAVPNKGETESIAQRRDLIRQDISNRRRSGEVDRVAMADRIETILNQIDGEGVQAVLKNLKQTYPANHESLVWYKDTLFPQYKDFLKNFDENFNDQANNYDNPNYLPIAFSKASPSLAITPEEEQVFFDQVSLTPKQSAYTIKRVDYTTLPTDRTTKRPKEIEFNLRRNAFDSLSDQINKAYTSGAWQQIASFMKTPEAEVVFGGQANQDFFIERLNRLRLSRMRRGAMSRGNIERAVDALSVISRKLGTGIALGGVYQWIKQPPDQLVTAIGSGGRYDLMAQNIMPKNQKAARELLRKFSIGRRGDASAGYKYINQMEGHQNRLERYFSESKWDQVKEEGGKIADVWMAALKQSDFWAASTAWMTYYEGELNKRNIKIEDWAKEAELVDTDPARQEAAAFAEQMTDIYQGSSDPTQMATFAQSGKSGWENLMKAIFVPFNSFAIQQRMRLYSDARDVLNGEKSGVGGLSGTIGGLLLFHATKRLVLPVISGSVAGVLYALLGVDMEEPDEEKQKEEANKRWRQMQGEMLGNLLVGGTPQIVEAKFIDAMNYASYLIALQLESEDILNDEGEVMSFDQYAKERSPFWRYRSFDNAMSLGMLDIGLGQAEQAILQTKMVATPEEMEMYTPEEQRLLYFSTLSEWLYLMRLNDADFARMVGKARRDMIKAVEDREKQIKAIREGR